MSSYSQIDIPELVQRLRELSGLPHLAPNWRESLLSAADALVLLGPALHSNKVQAEELAGAYELLHKTEDKCMAQAEEIARKDKFIHENGYADLQNCVTYKEAYELDMVRKNAEIDRLRAEVEEARENRDNISRQAAEQLRRLRAALEKIAGMPIPGGGLAIDAYMKAIAREALRGEK